MASKQLHLAVFASAGPVSGSHGGWRHPDATGDLLSAGYYQDLGRLLEEGRFDMLFIPDILAIPDRMGNSLDSQLRHGALGALRLDPLVVLSKAEAQQALLSSLSLPEAGLSTLSYHLGLDLSLLPQDRMLSDTLYAPGVEGHYREVVEMTRRTGLSVSEIGQRYGAGRTTIGFTGTPVSVSDQMQEWQESGACDGFMLQIPYFPGGLESVVRLLVPELQRRGLFRTEYTGATLRDHLGLTRPSA